MKSSLRTAFLIVACVLLPFARPALAQTGTRCTCADIYDLINRLNMAEAARAALLEELPKVQASDRAKGKTSQMDDKNANGVTNQDILRGAITAGMVAVQMPGASVSAGSTGGTCGASVVHHTTACMDEIVMWHEEHVHVPACNAGQKTAIGFRAPMTTVDYMKEEIAGYESEIQRIKDVLKMLPKNCRPSGWIGHIQYREERRMEGQNTLPPTATRISASERTSQTMVREAKILYREAGTPTTVSAATISPHATTEIEDTFTKFYTGTLRRSCTGGLATPRFDGTVTNSSEDELKVNGSGEKDVDVSFDYDPQTGQYTLSFEVPEVAGSATQTKKETVSGSCNASDDGTKTSSAQSSMPYNGTHVNVSGTIVPGATPDRIEGSDKIDLGPPVTSPNLSITSTGTIHWTFYKLPP
jgi:hypothetical protein